jgi:ribose transport system permease protein
MASISQTSPSAFIRFLRRQQNVLIIWGVLVVIFIIASFLSDAFTGPRNLINLTRQSAALLLVALAQTFILISGGIDISVGSTVSLIVMVMAPLMTNDPASMFFVALLGVGVGTVVGLLNGIFVTRLKLPPFMVTLATLSIFRGLALQLRQNPPATIPKEFSTYFTGELFGLPIPLFIILFCTLTASLVLRYTRFGRHLYAVGSNENATRLSGMPTDRIKLFAYVTCGFVTGLAGIYWAARSRAADPLTGENFAFDSITAAVLGGTSLFGGVGSVWGTLAGVLILAIIGNIMNLTGIPSNYQYIVKGVLLVLAMLLYRRRNV